MQSMQHLNVDSKGYLCHLVVIIMYNILLSSYYNIPCDKASEVREKFFKSLLQKGENSLIHAESVEVKIISDTIIHAQNLFTLPYTYSVVCPLTSEYE